MQETGVKSGQSPQNLESVIGYSFNMQSSFSNNGNQYA